MPSKRSNPLPFRVLHPSLLTVPSLAIVAWQCAPEVAALGVRALSKGVPAPNLESFEKGLHSVHDVISCLSDQSCPKLSSWGTRSAEVCICNNSLQNPNTEMTRASSAQRPKLKLSSRARDFQSEGRPLRSLCDGRAHSREAADTHASVGAGCSFEQ